MRLPHVDYRAPTSPKEILAMLKDLGPAAAVLAGGTDLVPRLRQRLVKADLLISLKNVPDLKQLSADGAGIKIGAAATLKEVMGNPAVRVQAPGLAEALRIIGAPNIQHFTGTIGGNLLLNTRCLYYNQSEWWRSGRDHCFKNGGQVCHAVKESKECSAGCQSDGAVMLTALSAQAVVRSAAGERTIPLTELFSGRGETPFTLNPDELLTEIHFFPPPRVGTSYQKLRWRSAVDFPLVSAGALVSLHRDGKVDRVRLVIGAASPRPLVAVDADKILRGKKPEPDLIDQAAQAAQKQAEGAMVDNAGAPAEYRRRMVRVMARRALTEAVRRAEVG